MRDTGQRIPEEYTKIGRGKKAAAEDKEIQHPDGKAAKLEHREFSEQEFRQKAKLWLGSMYSQELEEEVLGIVESQNTFENELTNLEQAEIDKLK